MDSTNTDVSVASEKIGGWLWFPALWTITNPLIAIYTLKFSAAVGLGLLALSALNAYLFWTKSKIYPYYFFCQVLAITTLLIQVYDAVGTGRGLWVSVVTVIYLFVSKRCKRTFVKPLWRARSSETSI